MHDIVRTLYCMCDYTTGHPFVIPFSYMYFVTGHNKYLGFLFLYSTYNNAVVHVFIQLLINSGTNGRLKAVTPETTFSEDRRVNFDDDVKGTVHDIELIEAEPADRHSPVPSDSRNSEYNRKIVDNCA